MICAGYDRFKIVEGRFVDSEFYAALGAIDADGAIHHHRFGHGDCGPFGDDIPGPWMTSQDVFAYLAEHGVGWKDLHATRGGRHPDDRIASPADRYS